MPNLWRGESDDEIAAVLEKRHPSLRLVSGDPGRLIKGAFNLEQDGQFLSGFQIEILLDESDVLGLPTVKEIGGRIPRIDDRHVNKDGSACLYMPEDLLVRCPSPLGLAEFLDGPVRNYFLGQACVEAGLSFPFGEWEHGADGIRQMLSSLLGFDDVQTCMLVLELLSKKVIRAHWQCPCGSRRAIRCCHYSRIFGLRRRLRLQTRRFLFAQARAQFAKTNGGHTVRSRG